MIPTSTSWRSCTAGFLVALLAALHAAPCVAEPPSANSPRATADEAAAPSAALVPTANLFAVMRDGGLLMWPMAMCSVIGLAFVFERLINLRASRVIPKPFVTRLLQQVQEGDLDRDQALALCQENPCPMAEVFAGAIRKWGRSDVEVEQGMIDAGERASHALRRYLRVFSSLTVIAPLLGLLGTVLGMIDAFNAVAASDALGRPGLLAKGISQALLNTAFGLAIAIPAQSFYFYFISRVDRLIIRMDGLGEQLVGLISAEQPIESQAAPEADSVRPAKPRKPAKREAEAA